VIVVWEPRGQIIAQGVAKLRKSHTLIYPTRSADKFFDLPANGGLERPVALPFREEAKAVTGTGVVATQSGRSTDQFSPANPVDHDRRRPRRPAL